MMEMGMPHRQASRWAGILGLATLFGAGCAVGPNYQRPPVSVPDAYKEQAAAAAAAPQQEDWKPAQPQDEASRGSWWNAFDDPVLDALEERVSASNQNILLAEAQFRGARAVARGARADFFPTIGVAPAVSRARSASTGNTGLPGTISTTYTVGGTATYEVDVWGKIRRNVESAVESAQASDADLETVRLSLHADLATDYFLLRGVDAEKRLLASNVVAYEKALQLTIQRHDQGVVSGVDVAQARTQLQTTRAQLVELDIDRTHLEHAIAILVGVAPADFAIEPTETAFTPPAIPAELPAELLERRPDIAAAERRVAAANAQIGVAQAAFFPRLLLNVTGGWQSASLTQFFSAPNLFWSLGAALAQTLFDGGKRVAEKEQTVAAYDATVAVYRESVLTSLQDVEDNLASLRLLAAETEEQKLAVESAGQQLELARNRYEGGITTYLEVLTAQAIALANARTEVDLETRQMTASVGLIRSLGGGWSASSLPSPGAVMSSSSDPAPPAGHAGTGQNP